MTGGTAYHEVVLLGAGASVDAGIPASAALTTTLIECVRRTSASPVVADALDYVRSALLGHNARLALERTLSKPLASSFDQGTEGGSGDTSVVDVEMLLRAVDQLARRNQLELRPFISSWDSTIQHLDAAPQLGEHGQRVWERLRSALAHVHKSALRSFTSQGDRSLVDAFRSIARDLKVRNNIPELGTHGLESAARQIATKFGGLYDALTSGFTISDRPASERFAHSLAEAIAHGSQQGDGRVFQDVRASLERALIETVWLPSNADVDYLRPLVSAAQPDQPLTIASLNYDNCIELAAHREGRVLSTGIDVLESRGVLDFEQEAPSIRLLKLHGSANWRKRAGHAGANQALPQDYAVELKDEEMRETRYRPAIIFGNESKLSAERPYFELFLAFRDALERSDMLTIIGYSFRDEHVNSLVRRWFAGPSPTRRIRVVDPDWAKVGAAMKEGLKLHGGTRVEVLAGEDGKAKLAVPRLYGSPMVGK